MAKHDDASAIELPETKISCNNFCNNNGVFGSKKYAVRKKVVNPHKEGSNFVTDYKCNLGHTDCGMLKVYNLMPFQKEVI